MGLSCEKASQLVHAYQAGALSRAKSAAVAAHLAQCERCRAAMAEAEALMRELRLSSTPRAPVGLAAAIKAEARMRTAYRRANGVPARVIGSPAFLAVCSSLLAGAIITFIVVTQVVIPGIPENIDEPHVVAANSVTAAIPASTSAPSQSAAVAVTTADVATTHAPQLHLDSLTSHAPVLRNADRTESGTSVSWVPAAGDRPRSGAPSVRAVSSVPSVTAALGVAHGGPAPDAVAEPRAPEANAPTGAQHISALGSDQAPARLDAETQATSNALVGALVAGVIVNRYVHDELVRNDATLLSVATSSTTPVGGGPLLTHVSTKSP